MNETSFFDTAGLVLECVCQQMNTMAELPDLPFDYPGCPCFAYVSPIDPPWDNCCGWECEGDTTNTGQLTVYISNVFQSINFPDQANSAAPCKGARWVLDLEITIIRCIPVFADELGGTPTLENLEKSAQILNFDRYAVLQAIECCVPAMGPRRKRKVQLQNATTVSSGDCAGSTTTAFVEAGFVCGCEEEGS